MPYVQFEVFRVTHVGCNRGYKLGERGSVPKSPMRCDGRVCDVRVLELLAC
jgi:hypothetical protein